MTRNKTLGLIAALLLLAGVPAAWSGASSAAGLGQVPNTTAETDGAFLAQFREPVVLFDNGNIDRVYNQPSYATSFQLDRRSRITAITTYHWNDANGAHPGSIWLLSGSGRIHGPWWAEGSPGQGGVPNAYWTVYPDVTLPAGSYTVMDSDLFTWSQNERSEAAGHVRIEGYSR